MCDENRVLRRVVKNLNERLKDAPDPSEIEGYILRPKWKPR
jgi:hypothetical protein